MKKIYERIPVYDSRHTQKNSCMDLNQQEDQNVPTIQPFNQLVVAAIDFGTTYSGYAYSFRSDYMNNSVTNIISQRWASVEITTEKTPTCVLFDTDGQFHSFGYEAENKYAELAENEEHEDWQYFKHFKTMLMPQGDRQLRKNMKLKDDQGKEKLAIDVFSASINYLKDELLRRATDAVKDFRQTDIHWVITVPAIWEDSAKEFMRQAANKAGIANEQLTLALEPEAAAIFCKESIMNREQRNEDTAVLSSFRPGAKFLLLDLGGGTIDITIEQVTNDGTLSEIHHPDGGPWGGILVDNAFRQFLIAIFGQSEMQLFSDNNKSDELYLHRNFESAKRKTVRDLA